MFDPLADWARCHECVQMAEELGFDSYWTQDSPREVADCWMTLAALAVTTKTIRLGSAVSCIAFRNPVLLARMAADVDRWSQGRLILGLGIGDGPQTFAALGIPFGNTRERQQALEEAVQVLGGVWGDHPFTFQGQHYHVQQAMLSPGPVQQPRVPILIAGGGERVTLQQVAQYADVANFGAHLGAGSAFHLEDVVRKYTALRAHCEALGRPYESVLRSYLTVLLVLAPTHRALRDKLDAIPEDVRTWAQSSLISGLPHEVIAPYQALIDAGVQYFIVAVWENDLETLQLLAQQVVPVMRQTNEG
jgi:alkanesulfonate monooxygenase SsuD/methylene tetrahydromethanopterin reductase-like flavin-dependent oxidoreductase (luciferase family)